MTFDNFNVIIQVLDRYIIKGCGVMCKTENLSPKSKRKIIAVLLVVFVFAVLSAVTISHNLQNNSEKPKIEYSDGKSYIEYKGKIYNSFGFNSHPYEFKTDEKLAKIDAFVSIYSLLNDENEYFLYASNWQDSKLYTCIDNFEDKYPFGEYRAERVTGIKLKCNIDMNGYEDYFCTDKKFIDLILNAPDYSDGTKASHPLKASAGFTTDIYVYEDNLPVSVCRLGHLAYYDSKWIFVDRNVKFEGKANSNIDTRTFTGIVITDEYAVNMLNEYSDKYFSYIKEEQ